MLALLVLCSGLLAVTWGQVVNREVSTVIDASTSVVRVATDIKVSGVHGVYELVFPKSWGEKLSYLSIQSSGATLPYTSEDRFGNVTFYKVALQEPSASLKVTSVFTELLEMYPAEIEQNENQLVRLPGSHYFYSPYPTESQKLVVKLPSSSVESFTKLSPHSVRGSTITFGPYKDVAAWQVSPLVVHYTNNFPFAKFSSMVREVEVSHWGSIAVEEIYELQHAGAKLKGGFSRFDYQLRRNGPSPSFRSLVASLPSQATDIYYRDQIGNISTSEMRLNKRGGLDLEIQSRFPLFGGWQTQFYVGYKVPTELALFATETGQYKLKLEFSTLFRDVWVGDLEFKVILPEGSTNIEVNNPYAVEESRATRYTFLDSSLNGGRPVVVIKAKNLVEEHNKKIEISYSFERSRMLVEPAMVVGAFALLFVVLTVFARTTRISSRKSFSHEKKE